MKKRGGRGSFQPRGECFSSDVQDAPRSQHSGEAYSRQGFQQQRYDTSDTAHARSERIPQQARRGRGAPFEGRGNMRNQYNTPRTTHRNADGSASSEGAAWERHASSRSGGRAVRGGQRHDYVRADGRPFNALASSGTCLTDSSGSLEGGSTVRKTGSVRNYEANRTIVKTNFFAIENFSLTNAFHYDVTIDPETPKKLLRLALKEFQLKLFPNRTVAFDGRKNLYTVTPLLNDQDKEIRDSVEVWDEDRKRQKTFNIVLKYAAYVDMTSLDMKCINVLDVVLHCMAAMKYLQIGRSHFSLKIPAESIGVGVEVRSGVFMSVKRGKQLFVNVDSVHKAFLKCQPIVDMIMDLGSHAQSVDLSRPLCDRQIFQMEKILKGSRVDYLISRQGDLENIRTYQVRGISLSPAELRFNFNGNEITVKDYYLQEKKISLKYTNLPCLDLGKPGKPMYVPVELCNIAKGQAIHKKLDENLNSAMIQKTVCGPVDRISKIDTELSILDFQNSPLMKDFGMNVSRDFQQVEARVLNAPDIIYANNSLHPQNGAWQTDSPFLEPTSLNKWTVIILDRCVSLEDVYDFADKFEKLANIRGLRVCKPSPFESVDTRRSGWVSSCLRKFRSFDLIFIVTFKNGKCYSDVKRAAGLEIGIATRFITNVTIRKSINIDSIVNNIVQKANATLGGINHTVVKTLPSKLTEKCTMYVGADVTHPSPGESNPSVVAVCASYEPHGFKYNAIIRRQEKGQEIIEDLEEIMIKHLQFYEAKMKVKPENIVFLRDGVGDGQFREVREREISAIHRSCSRLGTSYKPAITFLVVQKRHHARFFPSGHNRNNRNVSAGTVVDNTITHPEECEFYIVSHDSRRGVSRPCRYNCLLNNHNLSKEELEKMVFALCHMYSRCTRSVSYPTPTYYAHHAASLGKIYFSAQGSSVQINDLENLSTLKQLPPMHFL